MSNNDTQEQHEELASAFGTEIDPLAKHNATFSSLQTDPFEMFIEEVLMAQDLSENTVKNYRRVFRQWGEWMDQQGRHPACPAVEHVLKFGRYLRSPDGLGNTNTITKKKLTMLARTFSYFQDESSFPHSSDFNPFNAGKKKLNLLKEDPKEPPRIPIEDVRQTIADIGHIRDRAIIVTQLKLGLRATELCNITFRDVNIENRDLQDHYAELGEHPQVADRKNAVYIPPNSEREGNKSENPRVLPLDDEVRKVLLEYLLVRPDVSESSVFVSKTTGSAMDRSAVNEVWKKYWQPAYGETAHHCAVTSKFGRHYFTTWWRVKQNAPEELVKYMRGDSSGGLTEGRDAINVYVHTYYEDIESVYREEIFRVFVGADGGEVL